MAPFDFEIYFTGRDHPRDGCIVIGEDSMPVFFEFETTLLPSGSMRTTISSDEHPVAAFDWAANDALGVVTIGDREFSMEHLVLSGSSPRQPMAGSMNGGALITIRTPPNSPSIAVYHQFNQATPIGPSHGTLQYSFTNGLFLLEVLLALNLNRWLDWNAD
ncbi:hypothetical protein JVU11DRAFT_976 [Chiua virens]|nr:hypothetical protein JVU11DRAFT_976 [Chiua virens]